MKIYRRETGDCIFTRNLIPTLSKKDRTLFHRTQLNVGIS